jgi:hypothetical protein
MAAREADHPFNYFEFKNYWTHYSTILHAFMACPGTNFLYLPHFFMSLEGRIYLNETLDRTMRMEEKDECPECGFS